MPKGRRLFFTLGVVVLLLLGLGAACSGGNGLVLGATTTLQDTGLLDELVRAFEKESGYQVAAVTPVVAGSGQVLELARRGEVDVLITHSPAAEEQFVAEGHGIDRRPVMESLFLVVGPPDDPAGVSEAPTPADAFKRIAEGAHAFVSRGDASGTHVRELAIWKEAGVDPRGRPWYQESATGQGQNLLIASDKAAYTLVDSATFRVFRDRVELADLFVDMEATNVYSVILVNPEKHPGVNAEAALAFADFVTSPPGQRLIQEFGRTRYGTSIFTAVNPPLESTPAAGSPTVSP